MISDKYDKNDNFQVSIHFILTGTKVTINNLADKVSYMKIGGLPFPNQTYNVTNKANDILCTIASFAFAANTSVQQNFMDQYL